MAELFFKVAQLFQSTLAAAFLFGGRAGRHRSGDASGRWDWSRQANAADVEVFFEAVQLEEVG